MQQTLVTVLPVIILNLRKSRAAHHEKSIIYDYYSNQSDIVHFTIYLSIIICLNDQWYKFIISLKLKDFFFLDYAAGQNVENIEITSSWIFDQFYYFLTLE